MKSDEWVKGVAHASFGYRAEMFCPANQVEALNRALNQQWKDQGNNVSIALSKSGSLPATSAWLSGPMIVGLNTALREAPRASVLMREGDEGPIVAVLGHPEPKMIGATGHFWDLAKQMGFIRMPEGPV